MKTEEFEEKQCKLIEPTFTGIFLSVASWFKEEGKKLSIDKNINNE